MAGFTYGNADILGKSKVGHTPSAHSEVFDIEALSIIGLCREPAILWDCSVEAPHIAYVLVVATSAVEWCPNRVVRPSRAAWAELSVTPGLNPTCMAKSGGVSKEERSVSSYEAISIMGSANRSYRAVSHSSLVRSALT